MIPYRLFLARSCPAMIACRRAKDSLCGICRYLPVFAVRGRRAHTTGAESLGGRQPTGKLACRRSHNQIPRANYLPQSAHLARLQEAHPSGSHWKNRRVAPSVSDSVGTADSRAPQWHLMSKWSRSDFLCRQERLRRWRRGPRAVWHGWLLGIESVSRRARKTASDEWCGGIGRFGLQALLFRPRPARDG